MANAVRDRRPTFARHSRKTALACVLALVAICAVLAVIIGLYVRSPVWTVDYSTYVLPNGTRKLRAIIIPGCCNSLQDVTAPSTMFYAWLATRLREHPRFDEVVLRNMPDPDMARRSIWLPFIVNELVVDNRTVVIGHSSGAVATMRLSEERRTHGIVLLSSCHSDMGQEAERKSGYYPPEGGPWRWNAIRANSGDNIAILHADDDAIVPLAEGQHVAQSLGVELTPAPGQGHFFAPYEPIFEAVMSVAEPEATPK